MIENATIESTRLGPGRGAMTYLITVETGPTGGIVQSAGGLNLLGFRWFGLHLLTILKVAGVDVWENLPGKNIRIATVDGKITAIGHIVKDRWVTIEPPGLEALDSEGGEAEL